MEVAKTFLRYHHLPTSSRCASQPPVHQRQEGRQWRELRNVAGEGVEEADGGVSVPLQQEEAVDRVKDAVVLQKREPDADEDAGGEVEEADVPAQLAVAGVENVALGQQHPPVRVEARVDDAAAAAWADGVRPSVGGKRRGSGRSPASRRPAPATRSGEQILMQGRPRGRIRGGGGIGRVDRASAALAAARNHGRGALLKFRYIDDDMPLYQIADLVHQTKGKTRQIEAK